MKNLLLSSAAVLSLTGYAVAADLPSRKAPVIAPLPPMWTGFYAGLNAGYNFGTNNNAQSASLGVPGLGDYWSITEGTPTWVYTQPITLGSGLALSGAGSNNQSGFIGGGQVGYNYQWGQNFLLGLEADIQGTGINGTSRYAGLGAETVTLTNFNGLNSVVSNSLGSTTVHSDVNWLGTVRGRLGYLFTPNMLVYATGGLTYGGVNATVNNSAIATTRSITPDCNYGFGHNFVGGGEKSTTLVGWNVGGGGEWMFMQNWSLKAEAIYWNMGNMNVSTASFAPAPAGVEVDFNQRPGYWSSSYVAYGTTRVNYQGVIARAGVNYHFNMGAAPVVASY